MATVQQMAQLLMIDVRRIQQLVAEGHIEREPDGSYSLVKTVQGYIKFLKESSRAGGRSAGHARLAIAQAIKVEMQNYERAGELIPEQVAQETLIGLTQIIRGGLEGLPSRLANEFAGISDAAEIRTRLQDEHRAVLGLGADYLERRAATLPTLPDSGQTTAATAETDSEPVGGSESENAAGEPPPG